MNHDALERIAEALRSGIPGAEVVTDGAANVIRVHRGTHEYTLRVDDDISPDATERWDIAAELCRAEGLELVLTQAGIRLASSN